MERHGILHFLPPAIIFSLAFVGCRPDESGVAPLISGGCGQDANRISAQVDGSSWCANASVTAIAAPDLSAFLSGISLVGSALSVQVDSIAYGDHPITEANNAVLWMGGGQTFTPRNDHPGTLTVLSHDAGAHRLVARVSVTLFTETGSAQREVVADLDVTYALE